MAAGLADEQDRAARSDHLSAAWASVSSVPTKSSTTSAPPTQAGAREGRLDVQQADIGTERGRAFEARGIELPDPDDEIPAAAGQQPKELERELTERAGADDEDPCTGMQPRFGAADRAVRSDAGVRQRGGVGRVEVAERDQVPWMRDEHRLGVAAIGLESRRDRALATLVLPLSALSALPQPQPPYTTTGSPMDRRARRRAFAASAPMASIQPATSCPRVRGRSTRDWMPSTMWRSVWQTPAPPTRTRTSVPAGSGRATSSSCSASPAAFRRTARIGLPALRCSGRRPRSRPGSAPTGRAWPGRRSRPDRPGR